MPRVRTACLASILLAAMSSAQVPGPGDPWPPNVLLIVLDDVGADKLRQFSGGSWVHPRTPNLEALADGGLRFQRCYAHPKCSATRASILTGKYPFRTGIGDTTLAAHDPQCPLPCPAGCTGPCEPWKLQDSEVFLSELLKTQGGAYSAGYACGAFGKWHLTYDWGELPGNESHAIDNGFDHFSGLMTNVGAFGHGPRAGDDHFHWRKVEHLGGTSPTETVIDEWNATVTRRDAVAWINGQSGPFFAYVAFHPPHAPFQVPPKHLLSLPTRIRLSQYQEGAVASADTEKLFYDASLEAVDAEIGLLLAGIAAHLPDTMVFVIGDNGTPCDLMRPTRIPCTGGKGTVFETGVRVPLIVSGPLVSLSGPRDVAELVSVVDLLPTIAALAGIQPGPVDGVSFLPLIANPASQGARTFAFVQLFTPAGVPAPDYLGLGTHLRAVTDGAYKLMFSGDDPLGFYDLLADPGETANLLSSTLTSEQQMARDALCIELLRHHP